MKHLALLLPLLSPLFWGAHDLLACSVCQGDPSSEMVQGAQAGVIMMVVITYGLVLSVGGLVVSWIVRARRLGRPL